MARSLEEILADLNAAEKEYSEKCKKYGIEDKHKKKKEEPVVDENGNPVIGSEEQVQPVQEIEKSGVDIDTNEGQ